MQIYCFSLPVSSSSILITILHYDVGHYVTDNATEVSTGTSNYCTVT